MQAIEPPLEVRRAKRHLTVLMVGRVVGKSGEFACVVNDVSQHGMKARFPAPATVGERLAVSLRGLPERSATVRWCDGKRAGIEFDEPLDLTAILGQVAAEPQPEPTPREPRFDCGHGATLLLDGLSHPITLVDVSEGGAKLAAASLPAELTGTSAALLMPGLGDQRTGTICWSHDDRAGFRFATPLGLEALASVLHPDDIGPADPTTA